MSRPPWWLVALLVLMAFAFQGTRGIWEPDEGRYTAAGLQMVESGDWLVPSLDGERPHLTKPPVTYWAIAASVGLLGYDEWAARLPGALAFVGTGLMVFGLGRRFCASSPALPALVWMLSVAPVVAANIVSTDALLAFFEAAAMFAAVEGWRSDGRERRRWLIAMWVAWGLAFMTKGPPGLLPLGAMVAFLALHDRRKLRGFFLWPGLAAFAIVGFTWFAVIVWQQPERLGYFLGNEVYGRVFTGVHRRHSDWYGAFEVYLPVLLVGMLPWSVLAVVAAGGPRAAWRRLRAHVRAREPELLLLLYWFALPLVVFFLARSRLYLYVLPLFVPMALLLARPIAGWPWLDRRRLVAVAGSTTVALLALKGALAWAPSDRDARRMADDLEEVVAARGAKEIVFVSMKAFYGIRLYLDVHVESLEIDERNLEYADRIGHDALCGELARRDDSLLVLKSSRSPDLITAAAGCDGVVLAPVGSFHADGSRLEIFAARAGGA